MQPKQRAAAETSTFAPPYIATAPPEVVAVFSDTITEPFKLKSDGSLAYNEASTSGGAVYVNGGTFNLEDGEIIGNSAVEYGCPLPRKYPH
mgnify:CR=1 FL=1